MYPWQVYEQLGFLGALSEVGTYKVTSASLDTSPTTSWMELRVPVWVHAVVCNYETWRHSGDGDLNGAVEAVRLASQDVKLRVVHVVEYALRGGPQSQQWLDWWNNKGGDR